MNKIAGIEYDPDDLGQQQNPKVIGINPNAAMDGMVRSYKHGVDHVHIAMHYADSEIQQLAPVFAHIRANYVMDRILPRRARLPFLKVQFLLFGPALTCSNPLGLPRAQRLVRKTIQLPLQNFLLR